MRYPNKKKFKNIKVENIFLILALFFGFLFLVLNPPFQVQDESEHYDKAYAISEGNILTSTIIKLPSSAMEMKIAFPQGNFSPGQISMIRNKGNTSQYDVSNSQYGFPKDGFSPGQTPNPGNDRNFPQGGNDFRLNKSFQKGFQRDSTEEYTKAHNLIGDYIFRPLNPESTVDQNITAIAPYPPASYIGSAFGMFIGKLFNCSPLMLLYIGRLFNLLLYAFFIYFAIKIIPTKKYLLLLLGLMPPTLFIGSSLSADALTIAASFLTISYFFKIAWINEKIKKKDILIISLLTLFLLLSKQIYAGLSLLFFMIPKSRFKNFKGWLKSLISIFAPAVIVEILYSLAMEKMNIGYSGVSGLVSTNLSITEFLLKVLHTLKESLLAQYIPSILGQIGWHIYYSNILSWMSLVVIILVALFEYNKYKLNLRGKIVPLLTFLTVLLTIFLMASSWGMPGFSGNTAIISGIQPRYFIPLVPLIFLLINLNILNKIRIKEKYYYLGHIFLIAFIVIILTVANYTTYYGVSIF
ncbi:MAG: DUF2142 domain-containing protein [Methanobrevibacter sp.]|jgi:uncharacterized membrane protein|nr:DUF2142 domain-containing protein [Candidatus Methanovirga australis]